MKPGPFRVEWFRWGARIRAFGRVATVDHGYPRIFSGRYCGCKVYRIGNWSLRFLPSERW